MEEVYDKGGHQELFKQFPRLLAVASEVIASEVTMRHEIFLKKWFDNGSFDKRC